MDLIRSRRRAVIGSALVGALIALPGEALGKTPYFDVEARPLEPSAAGPVLIELRMFGDADHFIPGRDDEWALSFAEAFPVLENLLVLRTSDLRDVPEKLRDAPVVMRTAGRVDVAVPLYRDGPDSYEAVLWLPAGDWSLVVFPDRRGWSTPDAPRGYPGTITITVPERPGSAPACPVTEPTAAPASFAERLFGSAEAVGNEDLWVGGIGRDGVIVADHRMVAADGTIGWKLGWWRTTPGFLSITGRRLDAEAKPLRATVPEGYGASGFQASGVDFPTGGCWEITGRAGGEPLSFVTFVAVR
jgi:hypothetical protein